MSKIKHIQLPSGTTYDIDGGVPTFTGTTAEWNALTSAQKAEYQIVNLTDDYDVQAKIDDTTPAVNKVYSSQKTQTLVNGKYNKYCYGWNKHITIQTSTGSGQFIVIKTTRGEIIAQTAGNKWLVLCKFLCNSLQEDISITYAINNLTLELNFSDNVCFEILSLVDDLLITTSTTSTPLANTLEQINVYKIPNEVWTSGVTALQGATTCSITNNAISSSSVLEVFYENTSGTDPVAKVTGVSSHTATVEFSALAEDTTFYLRVTNL